LTKL
jgi:hypothetical protein